MVKKLKKDAFQATADQPHTKEDKTDDLSDESVIGVLTQKLQEKEKEAAENYDKYVRAVADLENYKKRAARDKADSIKYGQENLIRDILPLVDSLNRAMEHACNSNDFNAFRNGLQLIQQQLGSCLGKQGVEPIEAVGRDFDPNLHEAVVQVESQNHGHNQVVQEFEKGYLLNGRLLRPSRVSVCRLNRTQSEVSTGSSSAE
jgi:molecular chaperone GrpE